jgi:hypothetical protein
MYGSTHNSNDNRPTAIVVLGNRLMVHSSFTKAFPFLPLAYHFVPFFSLFFRFSLSSLTSFLLHLVNASLTSSELYPLLCCYFLQDIHAHLLVLAIYAELLLLS